jgi:LmbE family N-acetylglucosaminyl deacetylase
MLPLHLPDRDGAPLKVLALGAHCDDIEIGCGGTLLALLTARPATDVTWVVFSSTPQREREARAGAELFLAAGHGRKDVQILRHRDGFFPYEGAQVKESFERLKDVRPDVVFTHCREDRHQDHRTVSDLTWNTWRDHFILEYEIPKYDGDLGSPNCFVPLDEDFCARKVGAICDMYRSERHKPWFTEDTFLALMRLRGVECGSRYAEAFYCRKVSLLA